MGNIGLKGEEELPNTKEQAKRVLLALIQATCFFFSVSKGILDIVWILLQLLVSIGSKANV